MQQPNVLGRRIGAALIDIGVVALILLLVGALVGNDAGENASVSEQLGPADRLLFLLLTFIYFWGTEAAWAQTLGKKTLGLRVVAADGSAASSRAIVVRNVVRFVDWLPIFYIVGAVTFFATGRRGVRLGDLAAKTRVVAADEPPDQPAEPRQEPPPDEDVISQIMR